MNTESTESSKMIDSPKEKTEEVKKLSCLESLKETMSDQDFKQKIGMYICFYYRILQSFNGFFFGCFCTTKMWRSYLWNE